MRLNRQRSAPIVSTIAGLTLVAAGMSPVSAQPEAPSDEGGALTQEFDPASAAPASTDWEGVESDTGLWIVRLAGPSVSAYQASLSAQDGEASAAELEAFDAELADEHAVLEQSIDSTLGRDVPVEFTYRNVLNGMAVEVSAAEAEELRSLPGVLEVYPDTEREMETDVSHEVISSPSIWEGETAEGMATRGEGVVVGVIDSGINPFHPSFAETDGTGYTHTNPYGPGNYVGVCAEGAADYEDICNDKLIGAYNLNAASPDAQDRDNHGSHTASTAAGGVHTADAEIGGTVFEREVQGVAPQANVISYLVCYPGCPGTSSIAAVDQAIDDGVDVLNYSISGSDLPWNDPVDLAFRDAAAAGINVVASAGNSGPGASTVAKTGPWMASTAATTHSRIFAKEISVDAPTPVPEELASIAGFPGDGPSPEEDVTAEVRSAEEVDPGNFRACSALPADSMDGAIAFVERGDCTFPEKVQFAEDAGAVAVIIGNNFGGPPSAPGGLEVSGIPAAMIAQSSSQALVDFFAGTDETVTATWAAETSVAIDESWVDVMAGFSSRGPSQYDMVAPTYGAPGVNILAAGAADGEDADQYAVLAGTSMSSPHAAGATALMRALHPDWTPTEIRSALASSADVDGLVKEDGVTAVDPFDIGSGRLNLSEAGRAGLVLDESIDAMIAADPAVGGDPATLNLPAMVDQECAGSCSWERTVTNVVDGSATWTASVDSPAGMEITASPAEVTLAAGESATVTITATVTGAVEEDWAFGRVTMNTDATHAGGAAVANTEMPVAVVPTAAVADVTVDPDEITSTQAPDETTTQTLTVGNAGGATLEWEFVDQTDAVIAEQAAAGGSGIVSDFYNVRDEGAYSADQFTVSDDGVALSEIFVPGFWNTGNLAAATEISWRIYADAEGVPASNPEGGDDAVWAYDSAPTGAGVDVTDNNITLDVVAATGAAGELDAGTYWLSVYPSINSVDINDRWNWSQAAPTGQQGKLIAPNTLFGGLPTWTDLGAVTAGSIENVAYTLTGQVDCGADWVSVDPAAGSTAPGEGTPVDVTLDATGVEPGEYTSQVCIASNDPDESVVVVPITMTVTEEPLEVVRWSGDDRYKTAVEISSTYEPGVDVAFVATGLEFPDALAGSAVAGAWDAPVLLTRPGALPGATVNELARLQPESVVVLGGTTAVSDAVMDQITDVTGAPVERWSGTDRYRTAAAVAEAYDSADRVFVATGADYPDALAAASRAGAVDAPVLLVRTDGIPGATALALDRLDPEQITVLGGEGAVIDPVVQDLRDWAPTTRVAGLNRYVTAAKLMEEYVSGETVYIASGMDWPDALAGSAKAGTDEAPLLLTRPNGIPQVLVTALQRLYPDRIVILGGTEAVSEGVEDDLGDLREWE